MPLITFQQAEKTYQLGPEKWQLGPLAFEIEKGASVAIMGASGSGKSTLLHLAAGLDELSAGEIYFGGKALSAFSEKEKRHYRNREIGFVFQDFYLFPEFSLLENVSMPLRIAAEKNWEKQALQALASVGLREKAQHLPQQLSGGERQRAAIARAIVHKPQILFADEPTGNLDAQTGQKIIDLLQEIHATQNITLLIVTHDQSIANAARRRITLENGKITSDERKKPKVKSKR